jgi:hypothetical protein
LIQQLPRREYAPADSREFARAKQAAGRVSVPKAKAAGAAQK